jgi:transcriptional regulator GlxA family with amidase domain
MTPRQPFANQSRVAVFDVRVWLLWMRVTSGPCAAGIVVVAILIRRIFRRNLMLRFEIPIFEGFDELDALGPYEVLQIAREAGADLSVRISTLTSVPQIRGSRGTAVVPDGTYALGADVVIVPGGNWITKNLHGAWGEIQRGDWLEKLRNAAENGAVMTSVCSGAMILAAAGIIGNRRATTHHRVWDELAESGADLVKERVVDDGDLLTAGGITSGIDLALWLVERFFSFRLAEEVADTLEYSRFRPVV